MPTKFSLTKLASSKMLHTYTLHVCLILLALYLVAAADHEGEGSGAVYDIMRFGAVGNGKTDDTKVYFVLLS